MQLKNVAAKILLCILLTQRSKEEEVILLYVCNIENLIF